MSTVSNELPVSGLWVSSPEMQIVCRQPAKTPTPRMLESLTLVAIPEGSEVAGWCLRSVLLAELRWTRKQSIVATWLEGVVEYGAGKTDSDAVSDLVTSLGEYKESLSSRKGKIGNSARSELALLEKLIERAS